jgi:Flp pilus assembly protein TadG
MQSIRTFCARFAFNQRGNVAIIFALSSVALFTAVGGTIDFSRVETARRHMQDAADAALLRSISMGGGHSDAEHRAAADTEFYANLNDSEVYAVSPGLEQEIDGIAVNQTYRVSAKVTSYFGALLGRTDYDVGVVAKAQTMDQKYEIAMVLDTTGSMASSNKMVNLKSSVDAMMKGLLDSSGKNVNDTKVAVIPFNTQVRMATGECVSDRDKPYDVSGDSPDAAIPASQYHAAVCQNPGTLRAVQGLTDNIAAVRGFVPSLAPGGNTNITIGVQWGMEALSPSAPLDGGVAFGNTGTKKYMIVVTDGDNTASRFSSFKNPNPDVDARTAIACENAKAKGITVFVVKVIEGNSNMLRTCASKPEYFYDLTNASQINGALSGIFETIKKTRLTM